jgi:RNA recognition motif-containing protein
VSVFENAQELVTYLTGKLRRQCPTAIFLADEVVENLHDLREAGEAVDALRRQRLVLRARGRLFIGNLSYEATEQDVTELFASLSIELVDIHIPVDEGGISKGIAFVTLRKPQKLDEAVSKANGARVRGRVMSVQLARAKERDRRRSKAHPFFLPVGSLLKR